MRLKVESLIAKRSKTISLVIHKVWPTKWQLLGVGSLSSSNYDIASYAEELLSVFSSFAVVL